VDEQLKPILPVQTCNSISKASIVKSVMPRIS